MTDDRMSSASGANQDEGSRFEASGDDAGQSSTGREWMSQLQAMIDNVATQAGPVMRDIAAKAAELAAVAGEKAGPLAQRAAEATAEAGTRIAERGREVAAELRRDAAGQREAMKASEPPTTGESGATGDDSMGATGGPDTSRPDEPFSGAPSV